MPTVFSTVVKIVLAIAFASVTGSYFLGQLLQPLMDEHDRVTRPYDQALQDFEDGEKTLQDLEIE